MWENVQFQQTYTENQKVQFNLGNQQMFTDPLLAAEYLLEREYGDTYLYGKNLDESVFIPPFFIPGKKMYFEDVSILTSNPRYEITRSRGNLSEHYPHHWFTSQIKQFDDFIKKKESENQSWVTSNLKSSLDAWMCKMKLLHLIFEYGATDFDINMNIENYVPPNLMECEFPDYFDHCIKILGNTNNPNKSNIQDELTKIERKLSSRSSPKFISKDKFNKILRDKPLQHTVLQFLNHVELSHMSGEQAERWLFQQLQQSVCGDFIVLHSCDFNIDPGQQKHQEIDCLIYSASRKIIIAIEVKATLPKDFKAFEQLEKYRNIFEKNFGDQLDDEWQFVPVLFVNNSNTFPNGMNKSKYILTHDTDFSGWFQDIKELFPKLQQGQVINSLNQLKNILKLSVFILHVSHTSVLPNKKKYGPFVKSNIAEYVTDVIDTMSIPSNIIFYSIQQLQLLTSDEERFNKVHLHGLCGTGKTILLREKAEMLAKNNEKVVFVFGKPNYNKTLLQLQLEERWSDPVYKGNIVSVIYDHDEAKRIAQLVRDGEFKHVLFDEFGQYNVREFNHMWFLADNATTLWVIVPYHDYVGSIIKENFKDHSFTQLNLTQIMRNCKRIAEFEGSVYNHTKDDDVFAGKPILKRSFPDNVPDGFKPMTIDDGSLDLEQKIRKAYIEMDKVAKESSIIFLIRPSVDSVELRETINLIGTVGKESGKTVKSYLDEDKENNTQYLTANVVKTPLQFLSQQNSVLITDSGLIDGFEWSNIIVCFYGKHVANNVISHATNTSCFRRCTTNLILVDATYDPLHNILASPCKI